MYFFFPKRATEHRTVRHECVQVRRRSVSEAGSQKKDPSSSQDEFGNAATNSHSQNRLSGELGSGDWAFGAQLPQDSDWPGHEGQPNLPVQLSGVWDMSLAQYSRPGTDTGASHDGSDLALSLVVIQEQESADMLSTHCV